MEQERAELAELVAALRGPSPRYKRAEMDAVYARLAECVPLLVALVNEAADDPAAFDAREGKRSFALIYSLHLLARAGTELAHEPLLRLLSHSGNTADELLGGAVTEDLGTWLYATAGGRIEGIVRFIGTVRAGEWVRSAAVQALAIIADAHPEVRADVVAQLVAYLQDVGEPDIEVITAALGGLLDLGAAEFSDVMLQAIEDWELSPFEFQATDIDRGLRRYDGQGQLTMRQRKRYLPKGNLHGSLEWWAAFEENKNRSTSRLGPSSRNAAGVGVNAPLVREKVAKQKARRKAQKKARRKGRK